MVSYNKNLPNPFGKKKKIESSGQSKVNTGERGVVVGADE